MQKLEDVCLLLDKLTLDSLTLMEQHIQMKVKIEESMTVGSDHLAKSRYIMGQKSVSQTQLPTELSEDFSPLATVSSEETSCATESHLEMDKSPEAINPKRWFGLFVPQTLTFAQNTFQRTLQLIVQCANIQKQLYVTVEKLQQLRDFKSTLQIEE